TEEGGIPRGEWDAAQASAVGGTATQKPYSAVASVRMSGALTKPEGIPTFVGSPGRGPGLYSRCRRAASGEARPHRKGAPPRMSSQIDHLLEEDRQFPPSPEFAAQAVAKPELYES
ncbi:hypothetical protein ABE10_00945, partial [Bacillus toyonensis]|nr:hypothetical protein [Bacillus toyonensis]